MHVVLRVCLHGPHSFHHSNHTKRISSLEPFPYGIRVRPGEGTASHQLGLNPSWQFIGYKH